MSRKSRETPSVDGAAGLSRTQALLDWVITSVFDIGVALQAATDPPPGSTTGPYLNEALLRLDDMATAIRDYMIAERAGPSSLAGARPTATRVRRKTLTAPGCCNSAWPRRRGHWRQPRLGPPHY